ncbi:MAG TPA: hypothetical protein VGO58_00385 [Chitinophagaceae bacterium]|jgi:hypothetical protein|nr:hypothetical protein [Chitinophagaceae bacterium]
MRKYLLQSGFFFCLIILSVKITAQQKVKDGTVVSGPLPATNSLLELESNNKGLLFPRMTLTATNIASPLTAHIAGMTVYNTATTGAIPFNVVPGLYVNDGTRWFRVISNAQTLTNINVTNPTAFTPAGAFYDYRFQTEANDLYNEYNTATGEFTVARTGLYSLTLSNLGTCTSGAMIYTAFFSVNGNLFAGSSYTNNNGGLGGNFTSTATITVSLLPAMWFSPGDLIPQDLLVVWLIPLHGLL